MKLKKKALTLLAASVLAALCVGCGTDKSADPTQKKGGEKVQMDLATAYSAD